MIRKRIGSSLLAAAMVAIPTAAVAPPAHAHISSYCGHGDLFDPADPDDYHAGWHLHYQKHFNQGPTHYHHYYHHGHFDNAPNHHEFHQPCGSA